MLTSISNKLFHVFQLSEAIQDYSRLIHMWPDHPVAYILRGNVFREAGDLAQAKAHVRYTV